MLHDVRAGQLEFVGMPEHPEDAQGKHDHAAEAPNPDDDHESGEQLGAHLTLSVEAAIAAEAILGVAEQAEREEPPKAASAMDRDGVDNIVDLEHRQQHRSSLVDEAANAPDDDRLPRLDEPATGGDGDEACEDAVAEAADVQELRGDHLRAQEEDQQAGHARR
mmetsp:Transcript_89286/g.174743  ORF Transcript_89286/g.174743 Transcript_89286/m.174743 type:complete len:164 (+) Transcript_89286:170-661(+)